MCGIHLIAGEARSVATARVEKMTKISAHRGPDVVSTYEDEEVVIGFNRLEIVGGLHGAQPITNADNSLVLVGNGEIFNYKELDKGYRYKTASDLEIALHLYEEHGVNFIDRLEGQFSFVIFDKSKRKLLFARDRWGITPLYYTQVGKKLLLSSSIRALFRSGTLGDMSLDPIGLAEHWYLYGPTPPRTVFKNIYQIPPGSFAEYDLDSRVIVTRSYLDSVLPQPVANYNEADATTMLRTTLSESVRARLQPDKRPGVYVSGGVDSSIIAAIVNQSSVIKPKLFGIGFTDKLFDESAYQKQLADHLGCELVNIFIGTQDIVENIEKCIEFTESPLIRTAPVPMMLLSQKVRESGIKYVLCGEGADELFAGYPVFQKGTSSVQDKWHELSMFAPFFINESVTQKVSSNFDKVGSSLHELRSHEINTKLSRYLLVNQGDRVAMANSVEQRFPFLDSAVAELAASLSDDLLINDEHQGKHILRKAFDGSLPQNLIDRKKKGYLTPDLQVVKELLKKGKIDEILSESACKKVGMFDYVQLSSLAANIDTEIKARFLLFAYSTHLLIRMMKED
jgi:asparagine synthase (glutamine-hydrolysing)